MMAPLALRIPAVATLLSLSERSVARRIADGRIPSYLDGGVRLVRSRDLAAYVDRGGQPEPPARRQRRRPRRADLTAVDLTYVPFAEYLRAADEIGSRPRRLRGTATKTALSR